jgi:rhamnosyltransferase
MLPHTNSCIGTELHALNEKKIVFAVVVTFRPEIKPLVRLLDLIAEQVQLVIVVDNGSDISLAQAITVNDRKGLSFLPLGENYGIAEAQNRGILQARQQGATHVILFDQDSAPSSHMVRDLMACAEDLESGGAKIASVGPCYRDERQNNPPPFIRIENLRVHRCRTPENGNAVRVDYLIASGCLISMAALDKVGLMDSRLFIDYVDIEWGLRARQYGFTNIGCFGAMMEHSLGDEPIRFLGVAYPARSPLRHYYMFRNAIHLYKMRHVPAQWKFVDAYRLLFKFVFYGLFARPRLEHCKMMGLGLWHGLIGKAGKL